MGRAMGVRLLVEVLAGGLSCMSNYTTTSNGSTVNEVGGTELRSSSINRV